MIPSDLLILIISSISVVDSFNCIQDDNVIPVCSDDSVTSNIVYLSGVRAGDNATQCSCSLSTGSPTNITIATNSLPRGCEYKFQFIYMTGSRVYSCRQTYLPIIPIQTGGRVHINLLEDVTTKLREFAVCVKIESAPLSPLTLSCGKSRWPTTTSYKPTVIQTSTTENITTSGDDSNQPTTITSTYAIIQPATPLSKNDNSMYVIIGGSAGGLVVIIVIIIIVICVIRKKNGDNIYDSPEAVEADPHPYQGIHR